MENTEPDEQFAVTTPAHWKALAHPLRSGILELLVERAMTNEEMARALGVSSGNLYFHTRLLRDAGMIRLVETRPKGPIVQKLYRAAARHFVAPPPTDNASAPPYGAAMQSAVEFYQAAWRQAPDLMQTGWHFKVGVPRAKAGDFVRRMQALAEEVLASASEAPDAVPLALTLLLHSFPRPGAGQEEDADDTGG